jgi:hypothetical protein
LEIQKKIEKPISSQGAQLSPASRARVALLLTAGPCLSAPFPLPALARAPAISLWPVGPSYRRQLLSRTRLVLSLRSGPTPSALTDHSLARSRWPVGPACQTRPSRTARTHDPRIAMDSVPTTHAKAGPVPPQPFLATQYPTRSSSSLTRLVTHLSTRLAPCAHLGSSIAVRCGLRPVPQPSSGLHHVSCPGELCLDASNSGHPSVRPFPIYISLIELTEPPPCSRSPVAINPRPLYIPAAAQAS